MNGSSFVDLATKARELGVSEGTLRARLLSGDLQCFIYAADYRARAFAGQWLPAHDPKHFPMVEWIDHGSTFRGEYDNEPSDGWPPNRIPCYHIAGWVVPCVSLVERALTLGKVELDGAWVGVVDSNCDIACQLRISVTPGKEWVKADSGEYIDGGYWREIPATMTAAGLFMRAADDGEKKVLASRKEQSYLGIIAAMRALLRDKDGGAFPSEAKIIDQLVNRYDNVDGVSKRKLEDVFADATRTAGDLTPPK